MRVRKSPEQKRDGLRHHFAQGARALTSAENKNVQRAFGGGHIIRRIGRFEHCRAHGIAGGDDFRCIARREPHNGKSCRHHAHAIGDEAVDAAKHGVLFQDRGGQACEGGCQHHRQARIAAEADDGGWLDARELETCRNHADGDFDACKNAQGKTLVGEGRGRNGFDLRAGEGAR